MTTATTCEDCGTTVEGEDVQAMGDAFIAHVRSDHPDWPFPDVAVRNYAEAGLRLTGSTERLDEIGAIEVHRVTPDRIDDWLQFFDHDAFAGFRPWAACYCAEPHVHPKGAAPEDADSRPWQENRALMQELLGNGTAYGYLAYVDGKPAGWVNASLRKDYALYRDDDDTDATTVGVSCFIIAPPYRRHGVALALLDQVLADAPERGATHVEAYPFTPARPDDAGNFRGPLAMYEANGFEMVEQRDRYAVVRKAV